MKKLLNIIAFVFAAQFLHAQSVIDSTTLKIAPSRDGLFYQIPDPGVPADNVTIFEMGGKFYKLLGLTDKNTDKLGIYTNGNNYRARLQGLIDSSYITQIEVAAHFPGSIILNGDSIDFRGKKLVFKGGVNFKGTTKIKNVLIEANKRDFILDTTIVLGENVRFTSGEISVMNFGAGPTRTSIQNMAIITKLNDYAGVYKGQTILFPEGEYLVRRRGTKMIPGKSYTTYKGEGMYKTKITLDTADYYNFRRIFDLNDGDSSITIKDMGFNMNLKGIYYDSVSVDFEGDPGEPAGDYQCLPIFTYSTDSTKAVFDVRIENIYAENIPGDVVGISRNTNYVHIKNIRFKNYIRQGISLGGGNVRDVWIEDVFDLGSTTVLQVGGHSIHCEPSSIQWNINYLNSKVRDFSYSGVGSGSIIGITTTSNNDLLCNLVSNTEISDNTLNGRLQVSANSRGNIKINNNRELNAGVTFTTVSGASGSPAPSFITGNKKITGINAPAIQLLNVDSITVGDNNVQNTGDATISAGNCRSTIITRNRVKKNGTGNYPGIYTYSTTTSNYGAGMDYIDGNIVESSYRGIVVGNKSAIIGPANVVTAPTPYELSTAKIFPYRGPDGRQTLVYKTSGLPNYNDWVKGDVIIVNTTTAGEPTKYICDTTGALHRGNWNATGPYYRNEYVRDSTNGRVYRSKASNGQNELPSSDTDNTYWEQVATRTAVFSAVEYYRQLLSGFGAPTMTNNIAIGTEYIRKDGDSCTTKYIYTVNGWRPNSGCGGPGGGLSAGEVGDQIGDSLAIYRGNDTITVLFARINDDSIKLVMNGVQFKLYSPLVNSLSIQEIIDAQPEYVIENGDGVELLNNITGSTSKRIKALLESAGVILNDDTASVTIALDLKTLGGQDIKGAGNIAVTATKNTARDSIIITIGSLRLAIKDSVGSGGGLSGLTTRRVPFANSSTTVTDDPTLTFNSNKTLGADSLRGKSVQADVALLPPLLDTLTAPKRLGDVRVSADSQFAYHNGNHWVLMNSAFPKRDKIRVAAGVVRPSIIGSTISWVFISTANHSKVSIDSVHVTNSQLQIFYPSARNVLSFSITPDETLTRYGVTCGASVGTDSASILIYYRVNQGGYWRGNGSTYAASGGGMTGWSSSYSSGVMNFSPTTFNSTSLNAGNENIQFTYVGKNGYRLERKMSALSHNIGFTVVDQFGNTVTDAPTTDDIIQVTSGNHSLQQLNPGTVSGSAIESTIFGSSSNFWVVGVFEVY
ncbi:MAG: hypothetical protein ACTHMM_10130 [Agriterribacter sp.]